MADAIVKPNTELAVVPENATTRIDVGAMIAAAMERNIGGAELVELTKWAKDMQAIYAEAEFNQAMARFKSECPPIPRRHTSNFTRKIVDPKTGATRSAPAKYAAIEDIGAVVRPVLSRHGLSYSWGDIEKPDADHITITCIISHESGHSRSVRSMPIPWRDTRNTAPNEIQKYGIAQTYAQRYSLVAALGLDMVDEDVDGGESEAKAAPKPLASSKAPKITAEQVSKLNTAIVHKGRDRKKLCEHYNVESLNELNAAQYAEAMDMLAKMEVRGK